jgi:hypothetical protein
MDNWRTLEARPGIEGAIIRQGSRCCAILDLDIVVTVMEGWFGWSVTSDPAHSMLYSYETCKLLGRVVHAAHHSACH